MTVHACAGTIRQDTGLLIRAPRRIPVAEAVAEYMRVPTSGGNSVPWDPLVAPYMTEAMNCLASRSYDAVIFVGPSRTGKTIALIDGWVIYNIVCDPSDMLLVQIAILSRAIRLEMATPDEKTELTLWERYSVQLSRVDTGAADISWPEVPKTTD